MRARHLPALLVLTGLLVGGAATRAQAYPLLQLDISKGVYDRTTETIVSMGPDFAVYALVDASSTRFSSLGGLFVSAALEPRTVPPGGDYGTFVFGDRTVKVTEGMVYGVPPLDATLQEFGLPTHDVFPTYYTELGIGKAGGEGWFRATSYDAAAFPGGPTEATKGDFWAYKIPVSTRGLADGYQIHFDLYSEEVKKLASFAASKNGGETDPNAKLDFAPFSHDGESGPDPVPEPASLLLLGTGLMLAARKVRRSK